MALAVYRHPADEGGWAASGRRVVAAGGAGWRLRRPCFGTMADLRPIDGPAAATIERELGCPPRPDAIGH